MSTHVRAYRFTPRLQILGLCAALSVQLPSSPAAADDTAEITGVKDKLRVFSDGKKHYIALVPFEYSGPNFFYGDGTTFWQQRSFGGGRDAETSFSRSFWDPRAKAPADSMFHYQNGKYALRCSERETAFTPLPDAEGAKMIASSKFLRPRWKHQSYWLARDSKAHYYYVDRMREPEGNKSFRLFVGPKGSLKAQKMTKVVSNAKGDIFATKSGELRLVMSGAEGAWVKGKTKQALSIISIEDNHILLYSDLGVYTGEKLGTPCDDL